MKKALLIIFGLLMMVSIEAQRPKTPAPTVLSVGDIIGNYGIDSAMVNDTAMLLRYLEAQPQDYAALTTYCANIRTKVQAAITSLEDDYTHRDNMIWIDSSTAIGDYEVYSQRLQRLSDFALNQSIRYTQLEQQRIEKEKKIARQRAIEQEQIKKAQMTARLEELASSIEIHHRTIISACDGTGISDREKLKELKDLYYSYLMVYNKYDLTNTIATDNSIASLEELSSFQKDLLENVLGTSSLPQQIDNFKNILKVRCENENSDVLRSYTRVFRITSVPISFADVSEYKEYIGRLQTIVDVQKRYLQTLDMRATIHSNSEYIEALYSKKHKDVANAYNDVVKTINTLPAFTTNAESLSFIRGLQEFIDAQEMYKSQYSFFEEIDRAAELIVQKGGGKHNDVVSAYREAKAMLQPLPNYKDTVGGQRYLTQLLEVRKVQEEYMIALYLRDTIAKLDNAIGEKRKSDKVVIAGYKTLKKQTNLKPSFHTIEQGDEYLQRLNTHIEMQRLCLLSLANTEKISSNDALITEQTKAYRNISKSYTRLCEDKHKAEYVNTIGELQQYVSESAAILEIQEKVLSILKAENLVDLNQRLKGVSDIEKIAAILGM